MPDRRTAAIIVAIGAIAVAVIAVVAYFTLKQRASGVDGRADQPAGVGEVGPTDVETVKSGGRSVVCGDGICNDPEEDDNSCPGDCLEPLPVIHSIGGREEPPGTFTVNWRTNVPAVCRAEFGAGNDLWTEMSVSADRSFRHNTAVSGLTGRQYFFRLVCTDGSGRQTKSAIAEFEMPSSFVE